MMLLFPVATPVRCGSWRDIGQSPPAEFAKRVSTKRLENADSCFFTVTPFHTRCVATTVCPRLEALHIRACTLGGH